MNSENHNENEFEKQIEDLKEWQENQYNPGYYIGTGRVPRSLSKMAKKHPILLLIGGIMVLLPAICTFFMGGLDLGNIFSMVASLIISAMLIIGGIQGVLKRKK